MSQRYTDEQKHQILQQLADTNGDVDFVSLRTGIPIRTLRSWWQVQRQQEPVGNSGSGGNGNKIELPARPIPENPPSVFDDHIEDYYQLHEEMLQEAYRLVRAIEPAIGEAPLGQRVTALVQLIDRMIKLAAQLPKPAHDNIFRVEFTPDDEDHQATPQPAENPLESGPLSRSSLWSPLRKNRTGEDSPAEHRQSGRADMVAGPDLSDGESSLARYEGHNTERLWDMD